MLELRAARAAGVAVTVALADVASKSYAEAALEKSVDLPVGFALRIGHNSGVAFGAFGGIPVPLLVGLVGLFTVVAVAWVARMDAANAWLSAGLLSGGAAANLLDRVAGGSVTDFIDPPAWPAFNLADVAITAAIVLVLFDSMRGPSRSSSDLRGASEADAPA